MWSLLVACTSPPSDPAQSSETGISVEPASPTEATGAPEPDLRRTVREALAAALPSAPMGVEGMTLWVVDRDGVRLLDETVGSFAADRRVAVASASKLVSALVVLRTIEEGPLSFDTTVADGLASELDAAGDPLEVPEWLQPVTIDQLGGFVSGLPGEVPCVRRPASSLDECTDDIVDLTPVGPPGATFDYGSTHLHLAGRIVEHARETDWASAFGATLAGPLGLDDPDLAYFTLPQQALGVHPLVAGGLRATMEEYAAFLELVLAEGRLRDGTPWIAKDSLDRLFENPWATATMLNWPLEDQDYRYGFGTWLECPGPVARCDVISSPGAFGFTPWVDRSRGYFGILGMESDNAGGAEFSVQLVQSLRPTIEAFVESR